MRAAEQERDVPTAQEIACARAVLAGLDVQGPLTRRALRAAPAPRSAPGCACCRPA